MMKTNEIRESYKKQDWLELIRVNVAGRSFEVWSENGSMFARETYTGNCEQITFGKIYKQERKIRQSIRFAFCLITDAEDFPEDKAQIRDWSDVRSEEEAYARVSEAGFIWQSLPPFRSGDVIEKIEAMLSDFWNMGYEFETEWGCDDEWEESFRVEDEIFRTGEHYC